MDATEDRREDHRRSVQDLERRLRGNTRPLQLRKRTASNLFRYDGRRGPGGSHAVRPRALDLRHFDQPLHLDVAAGTLEVGGLATYERVVDAVLPHGLVPTVTPELKHITVGGAVVGIGIESNSFRYGFVHHALLEADVLLADGHVVRCSPEGKHADLFHGLPNSYGTLGYVLRATLRLRPARPYVRLRTRALPGVDALLEAVAGAVDDPGADYVEGLAYAEDRLYLTVGTEADSDATPTSIYGPTIFYREISRPGELTLTTRDYLFRYDPEWFWGLPESALFRFFRAHGPRALRHSGVYGRYLAWRRSLLGRLPSALRRAPSLELLIQDWEVPFHHGADLLAHVFATADLAGKPLMVAPLRVPATAPCYPITPGQLYLNVGSYNYVRKRPGEAPHHSTRAIDERCFGLGGIKMLYSTTFLDEDAFWRHYGGGAYQALKARYDPQGLLPTLFDKAVAGR